MWHRITFTEDRTIDMARGPKHHLEQVLAESGLTVTAQVKPYVREDDEGMLVETADLYLGNGETLVGVPFASFSFED